MDSFVPLEWTRPKDHLIVTWLFWEMLVTVKSQVEEWRMVQAARQFPLGITRSQKHSQKVFESKTGTSQIYCIGSYLLSSIVKVSMDLFKKMISKVFTGGGVGAGQNKVTEVALTSENCCSLACGVI